MDGQWEAQALAWDLVLHTDWLPKLGLHDEHPILNHTVLLDVERDCGGAHLLHVRLHKASCAVIKHGFRNFVVELAERSRMNISDQVFKIFNVLGKRTPPGILDVCSISPAGPK
jgi:hypothetical protein